MDCPNCTQPMSLVGPPLENPLQPPHWLCAACDITSPYLPGIDRDPQPHDPDDEDEDDPDDEYCHMCGGEYWGNENRCHCKDLDGGTLDPGQDEDGSKPFYEPSRVRIAE